MFAHTPAAAGGPWHALDEHLRAVAEMAAEFARPFGGEDLARLAGLLHDAGKAGPKFQAYLQACAREPGKKHDTVDHKGAGTLRSFDLCEPLGFLIHGHHGGLRDRVAPILWMG